MPYTNENTSNTIEDKNNKILIFFRYLPKWNVHWTVRPVPKNVGMNTCIFTPLLLSSKLKQRLEKQRCVSLHISIQTNIKYITPGLLNLF